MHVFDIIGHLDSAALDCLLCTKAAERVLRFRAEMFIAHLGDIVQKLTLYIDRIRFYNPESFKVRDKDAYNTPSNGRIKMILTELTRVGNGTQSVMPSDAALLSMLPFGIAWKTALAQYFSCDRNGNRAVKELVETGKLEEHFYTVNIGRRSQLRSFLVLTIQGMAYLAGKYHAVHPWLGKTVQKLEEMGTPSFIRGLSPGTVRSLLTAQACDVSFNVAGVETLFERLIYEPEKALTTIEIQRSATHSEESAFEAVCQVYRSWVEAGRAHLGGPAKRENPSPAPVQYYDAVELKVPAHSPYQYPDAVAQTQDAVIIERRERMPGHVGLLKTPRHIYIVYRSEADGISWNAALIEKSWICFTQQACRLGLIDHILEAPRVYPSLLLVDGKGQKVSAFRNVVNDPYHLRGKGNQCIGLGTSALHIVPMIRESRHFLRFFLTEKYDGSFVQFATPSLTEVLPDVFQCAPQGAEYAMLYQNRLPCYWGTDLDLHQINRAVEEGSCAIVCFDWQAKYIRSVAPDLVIVALDAFNRTAYEYER